MAYIALTCTVFGLDIMNRQNGFKWADGKNLFALTNKPP